MLLSLACEIKFQEIPPSPPFHLLLSFSIALYHLFLDKCYGSGSFSIKLALSRTRQRYRFVCRQLYGFVCKQRCGFVFRQICGFVCKQRCGFVFRQKRYGSVCRQNIRIPIQQKVTDPYSRKKKIRIRIPGRNGEEMEYISPWLQQELSPIFKGEGLIGVSSDTPPPHMSI